MLEQKGLFRTEEVVWSQAWLLVLVAFALDRRRLRSVPITLMVLLIAALVVRALAAGAHEYLIKPFTPDALRDKLELLGLLPVQEVR